MDYKMPKIDPETARLLCEPYKDRPVWLYGERHKELDPISKHNTLIAALSLYQALVIDEGFSPPDVTGHRSPYADPVADARRVTNMNPNHPGLTREELNAFCLELCNAGY